MFQLTACAEWEINVDSATTIIHTVFSALRHNPIVASGLAATCDILGAPNSDLQELNRRSMCSVPINHLEKMGSTAPAYSEGPSIPVYVACSGSLSLKYPLIPGDCLGPDEIPAVSKFDVVTSTVISTVSKLMRNQQCGQIRRSHIYCNYYCVQADEIPAVSKFDVVTSTIITTVSKLMRYQQCPNST
ncbi:hypothetical protein J6590_011890 [Homalodisca vitripennis]|nr:hypothetical protein J6590_011890 [Homalodisca vitripennis]